MWRMDDLRAAVRAHEWIGGDVRRALLFGAVPAIVRRRKRPGQLPGQLGLLRFPRFSALADKRFLDEGRLPMTNNISERNLRK
jgi:hypothetical protein